MGIAALHIAVLVALWVLHGPPERGSVGHDTESR